MTHNETTNLPDTGDEFLQFRILRAQTTNDQLILSLVRARTTENRYTITHNVLCEPHSSRKTRTLPGLVGEHGEDYDHESSGFWFWRVSKYSTRWHYIETCVESKPLAVSPDAIYTEAEALLVEYKKKKEMKDYIDSFVGFYPPNRLPER